MTATPQAAHKPHRGSFHWMLERLTSFALIPLTFWLVWSMVMLRGASYDMLIEWLRTPPNPILLLALISVGYYHAALGVQVIVDDYVPTKGTNCTLNIAFKAIFLVLAVLSIYSIVKIAF